MSQVIAKVEVGKFDFTSTMKTVLLSGIGLGVLCLAITFFTDDALHTRFWTNYLHNVVFFTGLAFMSIFILSAFLLAWAGWYTYFKRIWEAKAQFLIVGWLLMLPVVVGVWMGFHHLYHWADDASVQGDEILQWKSQFLNPVWFTIASVILLGAWYWFARQFRAYSLEEDRSGAGNYRLNKKQTILASFFLPIAGFTSAAVIWQWIMSIDAHWYSTLFAWYSGASWFVATMAMTVLLLFFLKSKGHFTKVNDSHMHDLGKFMFAFSVFWTYLWFSQFMLIWYANVGEETVYFKTRRDEYPALFFLNLGINFLVPFFVLMPNTTKRKVGTLALIAGVIIFGHWLDYFLMIKPGALHTAHEVIGHAHDAAGHAEGGHSEGAMAGFHYPGLLELGTMIGFLSLYLYVFFSNLSKAPLVAENDPYMMESVSHHVEPPYDEHH
ncbi:MAG: hypothetical protein AAF849_06410 [Bacteroidota bacterium]